MTSSWLKFTVSFALALVVAGASAAAQGLPCEPAAAVVRALRQLPQPTGSVERNRAAQVEALRALLVRFPRDVFVHERYQQAATFTTEAREAVIAEYRALADKHPGDLLYRYLAARAQIGVSTKEVIPELEAVAPVMPPARLALFSVYVSRAFNDRKKGLGHVEAFMDACPASLAAVPNLRAFEPSPFLANATERLRLTLARRRDPESLQHYSTLWALEFQVKPVAEHDALRRQVAADVRRLRRIDQGTTEAYYSTLQEGCRLIGDDEGGRWAAAQVALRFPHAAYSAVSQQFRRHTPYPKATDPPEKRNEGYRAYVKAYAEWSRRWPAQIPLWYGFVTTMAQADGIPAADVEAAGEGLLKAVAGNPGGMYVASTTGGSSFSLLVAHLYATKGVRLDRLPALVENGLAEIGQARPRMLESDLYPNPPGDPNLEFNEWYGGLTVADIWLKVKDRDRARAAIARVGDLAARGTRSGTSDGNEAKDPAAQKKYFSRQADYWRRMASLAELEGHKIDAMTFYQNALLARRNLDSADVAGDTLADQARALWANLGGTDEAWSAWSDRPRLFGGGAPKAAATGAAGWDEADKALPDFDLPDLSGTTWRLADFKGKTTLINVWSST
ncbi:MAG TPA: hypothetical protein VK911_05475 [Vicinamibacterales bacterium]|nr:hypothetical protein [Vicinamibacterales bacterium]